MRRPRAPRLVACTVAVVPELLSDHTTLRLGGPAARLAVAESAQELVRLVAGADAAREPVLVVGGGSNLVVGDDGWPGVAILVRSEGIGYVDAGDARGFTLQAGEVWDDFVALTVREGIGALATMSRHPRADRGHTDPERGRLRRRDQRRTHRRHRVRPVRARGAEVDGRTVPVRVPYQRVQAHRPVRHPRRVPARWTPPWTPRWSATSSWPAGSGSSPGRPCPPSGSATRCCACGPARAWCSTPRTTTRWSVGSFFVNPFVAPDEVPDGCPNWRTGEPATRRARSSSRPPG